MPLGHARHGPGICPHARVYARTRMGVCGPGMIELPRSNRDPSEHFSACCTTRPHARILRADAPQSCGSTLARPMCHAVIKRSSTGLLSRISDSPCEHDVRAEDANGAVPVASIAVATHWAYPLAPVKFDAGVTIPVPARPHQTPKNSEDIHEYGCEVSHITS